MMEYDGVEGFVEELGATVRECVDCSCLVPGGPTRCTRCARLYGRLSRSRIARFLNRVGLLF